MIKACIFDLDGTLADTLSTIAEYANSALKNHGYKEIEVQHYKNLVGNGRDELITKMLKYVGDHELKGFESVRKTYSDSYENNVIGSTKIFEGIAELLQALKEKNVKIAVLSNKQNEIVPLVVETLFGKDYFDICLGQSDDTKRKPSPQGALLIANKLNVEPDECLYIGDTDVDMVTGKSAKMNTVGVTWGFRDEIELVKNGADYTVNKPYEILDFINSNDKYIVIDFFKKAYSNADYAYVMKYFSENYVDHSPAAARSNKDAVGILKIVREMFPDIKVEVLDAIEEKGMVATRVKFYGTHQGECMGIAATGKKIEWEALENFKVEDGKITESWGYWPDMQMKEMLLG